MSWKARLIGWLISFLLIIVVVFLGVQSLTGVYPMPETVTFTGAWRAPLGYKIPAFIWQPQGNAMRSGDAVFIRTGAIELRPFADMADGVPSYPQAVLMRGGIETLWLLSEDRARSRISAASQDYVDEVKRHAMAILASEMFERDYRPRFRDVINRAAVRAWGEPAVQERLEAASDTMMNVFGEDFTNAVMPVVMENLQRAIGEILARATTRLWAIIWGQIDMEPLYDVAGSTLNDPAVREQLRERLGQVLEAPETEALTVAFGRKFVDELAQDHRFAEILDDLGRDVRLSWRFDGIARATVRAGRRIVTELLGAKRVSREPTLVSFLVKALIRLEKPPFLLVMSPKELAAIASRIPQDDARILTPET